MIQTFTTNLNEKVIKSENNQSPDSTEPGKMIIDTILNFSRNLEVRNSKFIEAIEIIKS